MKRMSYCGTDVSRRDQTGPWHLIDLFPQGYMSPEILLGFDFDERTDVFSLGIIVSEGEEGPHSRCAQQLSHSLLKSLAVPWLTMERLSR